MAQNEIQRLKDLDHPRVIDYYGCSTEHDRVVLFMEYMVAGSLRRVIDKHGTISEKNSIHYIDQILDGLTYIHGRGIVHRDLKCDNLLLDGQGNIKLGDFGIAIEKYLSTNNQSFFSKSASSLGTLHWMAPELIDNKGASRCSDIWSLGCTIVEMLTGDPPYGNISALRFVGAVCNKSLSYETKDLIPKASDKMQQFVSCLLQAEPEKRPHTGADATAKFKQLF
uniref:Protein kinase domain-containing protein n=1 Tax=Plectus sambesii TaxID=2011161 RepID=A0A914XN70_9BILA